MGFKNVIGIPFIISLLINTSFAVPQNRQITIENNCPSQILWGITGTPIQTNGGTIACTTDNDCQNWAGSNPGDQGVCDDGLCYFAYPEQDNSTKDSKPYYVLDSKQSRLFTVKPITRNDKDGNSVTQYTFNIGPQYDCELGSNGLYQCQSGMCGGRVAGKFDGQCQPSKGQQSPFTQIEMTTNDGQNDFYDLSIINGVNLPVKIEAVGTPGNQNFQSNFWCTSPGAAPTGNPNLLNGCSWSFSPPQTGGIKPEVFVQIDRSNSGLVSCATDNDCSTGQKCGLKYPEDLKTFNSSQEKPAYCGTPLGYYTVTQICSLGGLSTDLQTMFKCSNSDTVELTNSSNVTQTFTNQQMYQCATDGEFLDSCYNYQNQNFSTSGFCCGCVDWPGIPTDNATSCAKLPSSTGPTTSKVFPNADWLSLVKPILGWLIDGCPDAYEYQYGDKHGTVQCSTESVATNSGNAMNYKITFCPQGHMLFFSGSSSSITINHVDATVINATRAILNWTVDTSPENADYRSTVTLNNNQETERSCNEKECHVIYDNLNPDTRYVAVVSGSITVDNQTKQAIPKQTNFTTDSSPPTQSIDIENAIAVALSSSTISGAWDIEAVPKINVLSTASISLPGQSSMMTKNCNTLHCEVDFGNLTANTNYQITINAQGGGASAEPQVIFAKTKPSTNSSVSVPVPSKGDMNLTNVLGPGAYCQPSTYRFPYLSECQSGRTSGFVCVNEVIDGQFVGEWVINQNPSCRIESDYLFSSLSGLTAVYQSGDISFTFKPMSGWRCQPQGSHLVCNQS